MSETKMNNWECGHEWFDPHCIGCVASEASEVFDEGEGRFRLVFEDGTIGRVRHIRCGFEFVTDEQVPCSR